MEEDGDESKPPKTSSQPPPPPTSIVFSCQECGYLLHPGWNGTTLRVQRARKAAATRTMRRRQQRQTKQLALSQQKQAKNHITPLQRRKQQGSTIDQANKEEEEPPRLQLLQGDASVLLDRHHLVMRCGRCQAKVCLKGVRRESQTSQKAAIRQTKDYSQMRTKTNPKKAQAAATAPADSMDFVQLPPTVAPPPPPPPLFIPQGRKKKKKGKAPPPNKLLHFLSSLND
jgi:hypothetical protein